LATPLLFDKIRLQIRLWENLLNHQLFSFALFDFVEIWYTDALGVREGPGIVEMHSSVIPRWLSAPKLELIKLL